MSYRETSTVTAEADANAAIDDAIEDAIAKSRADKKRQAGRGAIARWAGRIAFVVGLSVAVLGAKMDSHWIILVGVLLVMLSAGIALSRLGGSLPENTDKAKNSGYRSGL